MAYYEDENIKTKRDVPSGISMLKKATASLMLTDVQAKNVAKINFEQGGMCNKSLLIFEQYVYFRILDAFPRNYEIIEVSLKIVETVYYQYLSFSFQLHGH